MSDQNPQIYVTSIYTEPFILLISLVFLFIALLTGQSQMTILILLVVGMATLTKLWSRFALSRMHIASSMDKKKVFPGESLKLEVAVRNRKWLPVWIQVNVLIDMADFTSDMPACENTFLLWFQKTRFVWHLKSVKRGCFNIGCPGITISDLFGFFPRQKLCRDSMDVIVYPKIRSVRPFSMPEHNFFGVPGAKSPVQDPVYVLGTREYQNFTPVKLIHWKASARYGKLQEKVCEPSVREKILIVVDVDLFSRHKAEQDFEQMLEAAASMALDFERRGNAVGFMTNALIKGGKPGFIPLSRNRQHMPQILETIARMEMRPVSRLSDVFHQHIRALWGINCIFCSHSIDSSIIKMKSFYAHKRIPVKYFVSTTGDMKKQTDFAPGTVQQIDSICL